jgi:hypothetical protein
MLKKVFPELLGDVFMVKSSHLKIISSYLILIMALAMVSPLVTSEQAPNDTSDTLLEPAGTRQSFTHAVLAEDLTATDCVYCPYASENLKNIYYSGEYQFYFVSFIEDVNDDANSRCYEDYNIPGTPTVIFDGGYEEEVGGQSDDSNYHAAIQSCGEREVADIDLVITAETNGDANLEIGVQIVNNEGSEYLGHLRVYITEIESRYYDYDGNRYPFAFLDYAFDEDVTIAAGDYYESSTSWDGANIQDSLGNDFGDIEPSNIMVIGSVFNSERTVKYYPASTKFYWANYVDETHGVVPGEGGSGEDTTPPTVQITNPGDNDDVTGSVKIEVDATDNVGVSNVKYRIDNGMWEIMFHEMVDPGATPVYFFIDWDTMSVPNGVYTLSVKATDTNYNSNEDSITVNVNNPTGDDTDPTIKFLSPSDGDVVDGQVTISVRVTDDYGVNHVTYSIDYGDWHVMTRKSGNEYEADWDTSGESEGTHAISIKAVDTSKNENRDDISVTLGGTGGTEESTPGFEVGIAIIAVLLILIMVTKKRITK